MNLIDLKTQILFFLISLNVIYPLLVAKKHSLKFKDLKN